ncbi:SDR family oxidoreductase [Yoonia sp. F2084L]|uniref:SDR family oxidoreductase n=1 Tax=Yoonia sp. F2084L TaxID=2926419 RepID=UPI001FF6B8C8|nr:SDR family oxidoreductase [Yoonia sp. F2084L]MCK0097120.1 SDR family oxidoreductase [Yoonia sp. F2084L]
MTKGPVLILGARSDIARAVAHRFAAMGHPIQLAARNATTLAQDKVDIELRYDVPVTLHECDALDPASYSACVDGLPDLPEIVCCAIGYMGTQAENERDVPMAQTVLRSNFEGPASILSIFANLFEERGFGTIIGISSVAGERGRATNYVYGSAKAGFTAFLSGLRNRLAGKGVHVITVLPGFVATQMTQGMDLPARLTAQPEEVATAIANAVRRKRNVVYVRPIWQLIMLIIRSIPEAIFKKLKI